MNAFIIILSVLGFVGLLLFAAFFVMFISEKLDDNDMKDLGTYDEED